jgi:hypothetical protein
MPPTQTSATLPLDPNSLLGLHVFAADQALIKVLFIDVDRCGDLGTFPWADGVFHATSI